MNFKCCINDEDMGCRLSELDNEDDDDDDNDDDNDDVLLSRIGLHCYQCPRVFNACCRTICRDMNEADQSSSIMLTAS